MNAKTQSSLSSHLDRHLTSWSVAVLPTLTPRMSISGNLPFSFPSKHGKSAIYCAQTQRKQPNDRISSDAFCKGLHFDSVCSQAEGEHGGAALLPGGSAASGDGPAPGRPRPGPLLIPGGPALQQAQHPGGMARPQHG